ncbi:MAG TPA: MFS transporter, partial [Candidatus Eisenbacteria bacterium]|nr:MFS transporter [Candidatus Eisenbacteria bacterium]
ASMLLLALFESLPVYVLAMAVLGVGAAFLSVAPSAAVGDVFSGRGGTVVAVFGMSSDLGAVAGPLIAGWLADTYSFGAAFGASAGVLTLGLVQTLASRETRPRPRPEEPTVPSAAG